MKVGFTLMPIALEGLGRISHLINIDTVEDLVILMKSVITGTYLVQSILEKNEEEKKRNKERKKKW